MCAWTLQCTLGFDKARLRSTSFIIQSWCSSCVLSGVHLCGSLRHRRWCSLSLVGLPQLRNRSRYVRFRSERCFSTCSPSIISLRFASSCAAVFVGSVYFVGVAHFCVFHSSKQRLPFGDEILNKSYLSCESKPEKYGSVMCVVLSR